MYLQKELLENILKECESDLTIEELDEYAFQATAYESGGIIDYEDFTRAQVLEELGDDDLVNNYSEYLSENYYGDEFYEFDDEFFETMFNNKAEVARAMCFGDVNWSDPYIKFDVYGNLKSLNEYELIDNAKEDEDYLQWLVENNYACEILTNEENKEAITRATLKLIEIGY